MDWICTIIEAMAQIYIYFVASILFGVTHLVSLYELLLIRFNMVQIYYFIITFNILLTLTI